MESEVVVPSVRKKSAHLMCGTRLWGVVAALACLYFARLSYSHVQSGEFDWPHDYWTIITYAVWVVLAGGLIFEVHCWRERAFFALVFANFTMGFIVAAWSRATPNDVRHLRVASAIVWALAALVSLSTVFHSLVSEA